MVTRYQVTLTSKTPLLMHSDNIDFSEKVKAWHESAEGKKRKVPGDDRSPAWGWMGYLYTDGEKVCMQTDNIMRMMMEAGAMVIANKQKTFKAQTQSGCVAGEPFWRFTNAGREISLADLKPLMGELDFEKHTALATKLGFDLFVKRAKIGQAKHVRVRPRFTKWQASGTIIVTDSQITDKILSEIMTLAGQYKGLCDWRPGSKTPGPFGMFDAVVEKA